MLKFDGGDASGAMTVLAKRYAPNLVVEHGLCVDGCPLNGGEQGAARHVSNQDAQNQAQLMQRTDAFRSYDTVRVLSMASTLNRQVRLLQAGSKMNGTTLRHFGGSGEASVTAALGGALQPMRGSLKGLNVPAEFLNYASSGLRHRQARLDEITRLVNFGKLAPPFGGGLQQDNTRLDVVLTGTTMHNDSWTFALTDDAAVIGQALENLTVVQAASARVARGGLSLPSVDAAVEMSKVPFVVSTLFPSGAVSITALGRTQPGAFLEVGVNVTQILHTEVSEKTVVGVFGRFAQLQLVYMSNVSTPRLTVWAQDLTGTKLARNITDQVEWATGEHTVVLTLEGQLLASVGLEGRSTEEDESPPGLVLRFSPNV